MKNEILYIDINEVIISEWIEEQKEYQYCGMEIIIIESNEIILDNLMVKNNQNKNEFNV